LAQFFEFKTEKDKILRDKKSSFSDIFVKNVWIAKLATLSDRFSIINYLNAIMQGPYTNLFILYNKIKALLKKNWSMDKSSKKLHIWYNHNIIQENTLTKNEIYEMCIIIEEHLCKLREKFSEFLEPTKDICKNYNWVINPFIQSD